MTLDVVVLRHGRTAWNAAGRLQGQLDVPLDDHGRDQAAAAATDLVGAGITAVVSSDLSRARSTAEVVAAALGLAVRLDARLREQHYGQWQGRTRHEVERGWPLAHAAWARRQGDPVGGEHLTHVGSRALAATRAQLPRTGSLLVVTHGDTARALLGRLLSIPASECPALGNGEHVRVAVADLLPRS